MNKITKLYGDGKHDDSQATQVLMNGGEVLDVRTNKIVTGDTLPAGSYLVDGEVFEIG